MTPEELTRLRERWQFASRKWSCVCNTPPNEVQSYTVEMLCEAANAMWPLLSEIDRLRAAMQVIRSIGAEAMDEGTCDPADAVKRMDWIAMEVLKGASHEQTQ